MALKILVTYDLHKANSRDYNKLYEIFDDYNGKQLTESSYWLEINDGWYTFKSKIHGATYSDDTVYAIATSKEQEISYWKIR